MPDQARHDERSMDPESTSLLNQSHRIPACADGMT
jgi:hypothetical protein